MKSYNSKTNFRKIKTGNGISAVSFYYFYEM